MMKIESSIQVYSEAAEKLLVEMMVQNMNEYNDTCDWWTGATDLGYEVRESLHYVSLSCYGLLVLLSISVVLFFAWL